MRTETTLREREAASAGPDPRRRLLIVTGVTVLAIIGYLTLGVPGGWDFVLPRRAVTLATLTLVGYSIGASTVLFQTITHNRILTPSIMGFDALYLLIQTLLVVVLGMSGLAALGESTRFVGETLVMVLASALLYRWLFLGKRRNLHLLVLAGVVLGVFFQSVSSFLQRLMSPNEFVVLQDAFFADFTGVDPTLLIVSAVVVLAVSVWGSRFLDTLDVLALGKESAISLGVDYRRSVAQLLVIVAVLVSVSTALVGPVTLFGLVLANAAYLIAGKERHRWTLPMAALLGVCSLVGGQAILEHVFSLGTTINVIIEFLGGITLIVLLIRGART